MAKNKLGGLGKGLGAIFMENDIEEENKVVVLKISEIEPNKNQPRKDFDEEAIRKLADSMLQFGVLQPIVVKPNINGGYMIVAGERRYRAARIAGLNEIPVIIKDLSDFEVMEIALVENLMREELSPLEEAQGYKELIDKYNHTQDSVASTVGKSRSAVANMLRLLSLPDEIKKLVNDDKLSAGHARALLAIEDSDKMLEAAKIVVSRDLSVRQTESLVKSFTKKESSKKKQQQAKPAYYKEVELALSEYLGTRVTVSRGKEENSGTLSIDFYSHDELKELANKLEEK